MTTTDASANLTRFAHGPRGDDHSQRRARWRACSRRFSRLCAAGAATRPVAAGPGDRRPVPLQLGRPERRTPANGGREARRRRSGDGADRPGLVVRSQPTPTQAGQRRGTSVSRTAASTSPARRAWTSCSRSSGRRVGQTVVATARCRRPGTGSSHGSPAGQLPLPRARLRLGDLERAGRQGVLEGLDASLREPA